MKLQYISKNTFLCRGMCKKVSMRYAVCGDYYVALFVKCLQDISESS